MMMTFIIIAIVYLLGAAATWFLVRGGITAAVRREFALLWWMYLIIAIAIAIVYCFCALREKLPDWWKRRRRRTK